MKRSFFVTILGLVACLFLLTIFAGKDARANELKFQSTYPESHVVVKNAFEPWFKKVDSNSNGQLKIIFFPPGALAKDNETFGGAEHGIIDIGTSMCGRNPGKFPLHSVAELPLLFPNAKVASQAIMKSYLQLPELQKEFKDVKILWQWTSSTAHILTTKKQIKVMEDLKGLKIIGYTPMMLETIKALGANPIQVSPTDAYLALERGMADGIVMSFAGALSLKLNEPCKFAAKSDLLTISFYSVMSPVTYQGLSADEKKIIDDTTGLQMASNCGAALDSGDEKDGQWLMEKGMTIYSVPNTEKERWLKSVQPIYEKELKSLEDKGYKTARKVLETLRSLSSELAN